MTEAKINYNFSLNGHFFPSAKTWFYESEIPFPRDEKHFLLRGCENMLLGVTHFRTPLREIDRDTSDIQDIV